jgi:hypothetical protein
MSRHLCSLYNNIKAPSQLQPMATYYLFKDGIEPKWEDPKNTHGGSWNCSAPRTPNGKQVLDSWWLHAVSSLGCAGILGRRSCWGWICRRAGVACMLTEHFCMQQEFE